MTTKEAFAQLISERAWYKKVGLPKSTAGPLASRFTAGENISLDKIEEVLEKAGYEVKQEKLWTKTVGDTSVK